MIRKIDLLTIRHYLYLQRRQGALERRFRAHLMSDVLPDLLRAHVAFLDDLSRQTGRDMRLEFTTFYLQHRGKKS